MKLSGAQRTVLARLEIIEGFLVVEVNSEERLARVRAWLVDVAGLGEVSATRRGFGERHPDADLPGPEPEVDAAVLAQVTEVMRARYLGWLDERIPALGGKTPREAVRTATGRREVARLIHSYPDPLGPDGPMPGVVPREEMLRELGLGP